MRSQKSRGLGWAFFLLLLLVILTYNWELGLHPFLFLNRSLESELGKTVRHSLMKPHAEGAGGGGQNQLQGLIEG